MRFPRSVAQIALINIIIINMLFIILIIYLCFGLHILVDTIKMEDEIKIRVLAKLYFVYDAMVKWNEENGNPTTEAGESHLEELIELVASDSIEDIAEFERVLDDALELLEFRL